MQTKPANWDSLLSNVNHVFEFKAVIGEKEYFDSDIWSASIHFPMMETLTIGTVATATLDMTFTPKEEPAKGAEIKCYVRVSDNVPLVVVMSDDGEIIKTDDGYVLATSYPTQSGWLPFGTFYIDTRSREPNGRLSVTAYDAMMHTDQDYIDNTGTYPMAMTGAVNWICETLGIELDSRSEVTKSYTIDCPTGVYTIREVLSGIAAASGANAFVTKDGKLYIKKLSSPSNAADTQVVDCSALSDGAVTIGKVTLYPDGNTQYSSGTGGYEIKADCIYATQEICDSVQTLLNGVAYFPYSATTAFFDPVLELGDGIKVNGNQAILASIDYTIGRSMAANIEAGIDTETEHEYPYQARTREERRTAASISKIEKDTESIRLSVEGIDVEGKAKTEIIATLNSLVLSSEAASGGASITISNEDSSVEIDGNVTIGNISANKITSGEIDAEIVKIKNLDASNINTGTLSAIDIVGCTLYADSNKDTFTAIKTDGIYIHALNKYGRDTIKASLTADEDSACLELGTDQSGYVRKQYSSGVGHTIWVGNSSETTGIQINFTEGTVTVYKNGTATAL